ncbi:MAG: Eco57I restriction-modification methylase domain-containing protein [Planktothrix sp. GU0601_MAG3]|nr:MAG: Eco57I restriction-modification methylase domain-containing protein [Planktothrix sp. GU0601_MAG3]
MKNNQRQPRETLNKDSNTLDKSFYSELLHIIGLTEIKEKNKKLIKRQPKAQRNPGSLLENAISKLNSLDKISRLEKPEQFGETASEQVFNIALELSITWINRILFLKLLESQLITYHKGECRGGAYRNFAFLNSDKIYNFYNLNRLFFQVLSVKQNQRQEDVKTIFAHIPYLNSSLFEPTELEDQTLVISDLGTKKLPICSTTILKDHNGNKRTGELNTLQYLFEFLDAYDFSSEGLEGIQEDQKTLINASVLGLIFEKINGYQDGSYFTPGFITMYMCRETLRKAVVQKFNEIKGWNCQNLDDLYDKIEDRNEANQIINSLKICDPAVGSGHFLVSALNEIIAIKNDLNILQYQTGKRLKEYQIRVENDHLIIRDKEHKLFSYIPQNPESQRLQETLFHEKQTIIENCLFGVDINPNSVKICQLRLGIELLKNAYYKNSDYSELKTLPNIDINIKCGNSLISRFPLDADLKPALKKSGIDIKTYQNAVQTYRHAENKQQKRDMERLINSIKSNFKTTLQGIDPKKTKLRQLEGEVYNLEHQLSLFEETKTEQKAREKKVIKLNNEIDKLRVEIEEIESGKIYDHAFEWRFEFPEILDDEGKFIGFDVVIGNPPYMGFKEVSNKEFYNHHYFTAKGKYDIYVLFIELLNQITKKSSYSAYILPHKYLVADFATNTREYLKQNQFVNKIIHFEDHKVFEDATTYTCISFFSRNNSQLEFIKIHPEMIKYGEYLKFNRLMYGELNQNPWNLSNSKIHQIIDCVKTKGEPINSIFKGIFQGIISGDNDIFYLYNCIELEAHILGYSKALNNQVKLEKQICKPLLTGKNIEKWKNKNSDLYIIYPYYLLNNRTMLIPEKQLVEDYPLTYQYLKIHKKRLSMRGSSKMKYPAWYALWNSRQIINLNSPKILTPDICLGTKMSLDREGNYFHNDTTYALILKTDVHLAIEYFLAILNSRLIWFFLSNTGNIIRGGYSRFKTKYLEPLSIPLHPTDKQQNELINLASKLINETSINNSLEQQIDQLVYELYGLTEAEIKIVEGKT